MSEQTGFIELDRAVEAITVGPRHRTDFGDIDELAASIEREGLLQPITITPEGVLVCGARRLAAIKQLGWRKTNVWVRSGISDKLGHLLAEQDENTLHKPLTQQEAAALYRELKQLLAEDAERRKASTQFHDGHQPGEHGGGNFPPPAGSNGKTREQAAAMIPGSASYKTLEKINYLQHLTTDPTIPDELRNQAEQELERIDAGAPVDPAYRQLREAAEAAQQQRVDQLHRLADEAVAKAKAATKKRSSGAQATGAATGEVPRRYPTRAFWATWGELADWWTHYDPDQLAAELTNEQYRSFQATVEGTLAFAEKLHAAREARTDNTSTGGTVPVRGHLRAL
ncbi:ParB N-terminal domain-containing protein [Nesterenkonia massiliensis]|uniref:ParB N-terminal domain-containing protein n=1 Tax=Nesterenkonia massiliensis TaxID=1232429 RepID=A0ABT2HSJ0_9MICC|nr:ParB N-terminal domain-containing protein [Nesterenkonia massiliensis]MCT1607677.1 ParB N-terminal domain-containing protein [Nesterenkonia massiliensis]